MMIVLLGPDGCGKTTVIQELKRTLISRFKCLDYFHLRFRLSLGSCHQEGPPVTEPHNQKPYSLVVSTIKVIYFVFLYNLGYWLHFRAVQSKDALVIFDRYYQDLIIDPLRFRYGGPAWLTQAAARLIPRPDLFILLDAPADILQSRKQEVAFVETVRQREAYVNLFHKMPNSVVVNSDQSISQIVQEITNIVLAKRVVGRAVDDNP